VFITIKDLRMGSCSLKLKAKNIFGGLQVGICIEEAEPNSISL
jgi:hypothetical protein